VPLGPGGGSNGLVAEGRPLTMESSVSSLFRIVPPGHFETLGVPLRRGRDFGADDRAGGERVMIVNETLARALFPDHDPIGRRVSCCEGGPEDPRWKTIVGVVADVRTRGPGQEPPREFFLPLAQAPDDSWDWYSRTLNVVLRARGGDPMALVPAAREAVRRVDPTVPLYAVGTLDHAVANALAPARFNSSLLGALAVSGLVLALVGIYGVVSYLVARRRPELGVRQALGASPAALVRLVVSQGLRPVVLGLVAGALGALASARLLGGQLHGVSPTDPLSFAAVAAVLAAVAVIAAWVPARRATRVDSLAAIRSE
jgi:predicted permease